MKMAMDLVYFYNGGLSSENALSMPLHELYAWADRAVEIARKQKAEANKHG